MSPHRNVLIAIVLGLLVAVGLSVFRVMSIQPLEPPPVRELPDAPEQPGPTTSSAQQSAQGRAVVPAVASSGNENPHDLVLGRVRGQIDIASGETFPAQFELTIEIAATPPRVLSFKGLERVVALDLPLGRSILRAHADGLASRQLVITRDSFLPTPPFRLVLEPAGRLGGQVLDARGAPLAELPVSLLATNYPDARTVVSDLEGRYAFTDIPVGPYRVAFGASDSPIAPIVPVEVESGEIRDVAPQRMPELGEGEVRVLDRASQPVAGARVFGAGQRGGWIEGVSDENGVVRARFLPAGTFFLNVTTESGRSGQGSLEIDIGRIGRAVVNIKN